MAQTLLTAAGVITLLMGTGHLLLTLHDVRRPTAFTPKDESVRLAMQGAQLRFNRRINLWESWPGFNISHSLGVMMFGAALLFAARVHLAAFLESSALQATAVLIPVTYLIVAVRFWFWGPILGLSIVLLCILGAVLV